MGRRAVIRTVGKNWWSNLQIYCQGDRLCRSPLISNSRCTKAHHYHTPLNPWNRKVPTIPNLSPSSKTSQRFPLQRLTSHTRTNKIGQGVPRQYKTRPQHHPSLSRGKNRNWPKTIKFWATWSKCTIGRIITKNFPITIIRCAIISITLHTTMEEVLISGHLPDAIRNINNIRI